MVLASKNAQVKGAGRVRPRKGNLTWPLTSILLILIVINGVFAMSEMAIASSRKARLQQWADEGNSGAAAALHLAEHPNRFLATVQIGITLIGIITGFFGGARSPIPWRA